MSECWHYKCLICGARSEEGINHGDEILLNILKVHYQLTQILENEDGYLEIGVMGHSPELISFLTSHHGKGHDVVVESEYSSSGYKRLVKKDRTIKVTKGIGSVWLEDDRGHIIDLPEYEIHDIIQDIKNLIR